MKVVLQRADGLFWADYGKVSINGPESQWVMLDKALIEDSSTSGCSPGERYVVDSYHEGIWIRYPLENEVAMSPPGFTLEELEEAKRMIEGT